MDGSTRSATAFRNPLKLVAAVAITLGVGSLGLMAWAVLKPDSHMPAGAEPQRTIEVSITEGLRFDPDRLTARSGETIRFVIANPTQVDHEFAIGDLEMQRMHAGQMATGMMHDDAHSVFVPAGETRELVYVVGAPGELQIGCHVAGHSEAGMHANVSVLP